MISIIINSGMISFEKNLNAAKPPEQSKGCLKKNQNAARPSEHPPVREKNVKTFRWDHRLQIIQNLFVAFKRVPL